VVVVAEAGEDPKAAKENLNRLLKKHQLIIHLNQIILDVSEEPRIVSCIDVFVNSYSSHDWNRIDQQFHQWLHDERLLEVLPQEVM